MNSRGLKIGLGVLDGTLLSLLAVLGPAATAAFVAVSSVVVFAMLSAVGLPLIMILTSHVSEVPGLSNELIRYAKWGIVITFFVLAVPRVLGRMQFRFLALDRHEALFALFLAWSMVCSLLAIAPGGSLSEVARLATMIPAYYVVRRLCTTRTQFLILLAAFALAVLTASVASYNQLITEGLIRVRGMFQNANMLGVFMAFTLPAVAIGSIVVRSRFARAAFLVCLLFGTLALMLSWSRAGYLAVFVQVVTYLTLERQRRILAILLGTCVVALIIVIAVPSLRETGVTALRLQGGTTHRTILWEKGLRAFADNPLFGVGFNVPKEAVAGRIMWNDFVENLLYADPQTRFAPHNLYLYVLMSTGVVGFTILSIFYYSLLKQQFKCRRNAPTSTRRRVHSVVIAMLFGTLAYGFFESHGFLGHGSWAVYFWMLLGMLNSDAVVNLDPKGLASAGAA